MQRVVRMRRFIWIAAIVVTILAIVLLVVFYILPSIHRSHLKPIELRGGTLYVRVVETPADREKGLSGVKRLPHDEGLLFDFKSDAQWGIWMKDMYIPIDIIWLDKDRKVVHIVRDAQPELSTKKTFRPTEDARYIIEVNSGKASRYMIKTGDVIQFDKGEK
jgi:uncharacterized membrane protein (UPF0127 family)